MPITYENATPLRIAQFQHAMNYLANAPKVQQILAKSVFENLVISFNENEHNARSGDKIYWDPNVTLNVRQADGTIGAQSPALGLLHELYHWLGAKQTPGAYNEWLNLQDEIAAANFLGEPIRTSYSGTTYSPNPYTLVSNPTAHTKGGYWKAVDPNGIEVQTAQSFDPNAPAVIVITDPPSGGGGGEGTSGSTYGGSGSSSGGSSGGGTGTVVVQPVPNPEPDENPEIVIDPYPIDLALAPDPVGIVGMPEPIL